MSILERVQIRLEGEEVEVELLNELITTASDRVMLRAGETTLPALFNSIVVDVVAKAYNRRYHEGITSESVDGATTISLVDDLLYEYTAELEEYKKRNSGRATVHFY